MVNLSNYDKGIANYIVDRNKAALNRIAPDCASLLIAIRNACKVTADAIGRTELKEEPPLTRDQWLKITRWIKQAFFE